MISSSIENSLIFSGSSENVNIGKSEEIHSCWSSVLTVCRIVLKLIYNWYRREIGR